MLDQLSPSLAKYGDAGVAIAALGLLGWFIYLFFNKILPVLNGIIESNTRLIDFLTDRDQRHSAQLERVDASLIAAAADCDLKEEKFLNAIERSEARLTGLLKDLVRK